MAYRAEKERTLLVLVKSPSGGDGRTAELPRPPPSRRLHGELLRVVVCPISHPARRVCLKTLSTSLERGAEANPRVAAGETGVANHGRASAWQPNPEPKCRLRPDWQQGCRRRGETPCFASRLSLLPRTCTSSRGPYSANGFPAPRYVSTCILCLNHACCVCAPGGCTRQGRCSGSLQHSVPPFPPPLLTGI